MRLTKKVIKLLFIIFFTSLFLSFLLVLNYTETVICNYVLNLLMSIYASSGLLLIITTIEYYDNKRNSLENFYIYSISFARLYLKMKPFIQEEYEKDNTHLQEVLIICEEIVKVDIEKLGTLYSKISLMKDKNMQMQIYNKIYKRIKFVHDELDEALRHSRNGANDKIVIYAGISKIQPIFFKSKIRMINDSYWIQVHNILAEEIFKSCEELRSYIYGVKEELIDIQPTVTKIGKNKQLK